jgi:GTP-binding protein
MTFVDEARIRVKSGDGGQGCESFYRDRWMRYPRPDGGNGGPGGDVIVTADRGLQTLLDLKYKQHYRAAKGGNASSKGKTGKEGADCVIRVPVGTILRDHATGLLIRDLVEDKQSVVIVQGAPGGLGNEARKTITQPGTGEERTLDVELKLIADVGIIGFPNAGKSTFLTGISNAKSKVASYPFTTKQPILGIVRAADDDPNGKDFVIADLPGIIEGAHQGAGLGTRFLGHVERCPVLLHLVDATLEDVAAAWRTVRGELKAYGAGLARKPEIVALNKCDALVPEAVGEKRLALAQARFGRQAKKKLDEIAVISGVAGTGLKELVRRLRAVARAKRKGGKKARSGSRTRTKSLRAAGITAS